MKQLILIFVLSITGLSLAQVGVNTNNPKAMLEIESSSLTLPNELDGILIPKMNSFSTTNPGIQQDGMLIFITGDGTETRGFYYWQFNTMSWIPLINTSAGGTDADWYKAATSTVATDITDNVYTEGKVGIAVDDPVYTLDILSEDVSRGTNLEIAGITDGEVNGNYNEFNTTGNGSHYSYRSIMNGLGNGSQYGVHSLLTGENDGDQIGTTNEITNNGDGIIKGSYNLIDGDGIGEKTGVDVAILSNEDGLQTGFNANISNNSSATRRGLNINMSGVGTGPQIGSMITINGNDGAINKGAEYTFNGLDTGENTGMFNNFNSGGYGFRTGTDNRFSRTTGGTGLIRGTRNLFSSDESSITFIGTSNSFTNNSSGNATGTINNFSGSGDANVYGIRNTLSLSGNGQKIGVRTDINTDGDGIHIGIRNSIKGTGSGIHEGIRNNIKSTGNAQQFGTNNHVYGSGTNNHYGIMNRLGYEGTLAVTGPGDKYGSYNIIDVLAGGTHYGLYSNVQKAGSYAGFFIGNVQITGDVVTTGQITANNYVATVTAGGAGYADYVFEKYYKGFSEINNNYNFSSIDDTERFVKENGHLPGVASYKEVKANGFKFDLSELSLSSLEKIEEQFLYIAELNKQLKEQKQAYNNLKERLDKQAKELLELKELIRGNKK